VLSVSGDPRRALQARQVISVLATFWEDKLQKNALVAILTVVILIVPSVARSEEPDALAVEWQGQKLCEKLHEDDQIRIFAMHFPARSKASASPASRKLGLYT
jgi:hypothetical protein